MKPRPPRRPPFDPPGHLAALLQLLGRLRHAYRGFMLLRLSWLLVVAALLTPLLALAVVRYHGHPFLAARIMHLGLVLAALALCTRIAALIWPRISPASLSTHQEIEPETARLAKLAPSLGSGVASAVALGSRSTDAQGGLGSLVEAHLGATRRAVEAAEPEALLARLQAQRLRPWRRGCARLLIVCAAVAAVGRHTSLQLWAALQGVTPIETSADPLWADVEVQVQPPAYSHLPTLPWAPMGTQVQALTGSSVAIRGKTEAAYAQGLFAFDSQQPLQPWRPDGEGLWHIEGVLQQSVAVKAVFINSRGVGLMDATPRTVVALPDAAPSARIDAPEEEVVLKDHEQFVLTWQAQDDLGLAAVRLAIVTLDGRQSAGDTNVTFLPLPEGKLTRGSIGEEGPLGPGVRQRGSVTLSARSLGLKPGPGVQLEIEAQDTAPSRQVGRSAPLRVCLFSQRAHHEALLAQQEQAMHGLVDWLALELALRLGPTPKRPLSPLTALAAQVTTSAGALQQLSAALSADALSDDGERLAMEHIAAHAAAAHRALQAAAPTLTPLTFVQQQRQWQSKRGAHARRISTLERDILYLDDLLAHGRLDVLQDHVKDLLAAKRELQDVIGRYKETGDAALKAQMAARMAALKQQVQELLQKMAALRPGLPEGFYNTEAKNQDPWDQTMERLDAAMASDDVDAMAQDLEHMANMVDNAAKELQDREEEQAQEHSGPIQQELQKLAQQLQHLEAQQQRLQHEGDALAAQALQEAAMAQLQGAPHSSNRPQNKAQALQKVLDHVLEHLARADKLGHQALPQLTDHQGAYQALKHGLDGVADTAALVRNHALSEALDRIQQSGQLLAPVRIYGGPKQYGLSDQLGGTQEAVREAQKALEKLLDGASGPMSKALQNKADALQQQQQQLQGEAQEASNSAQQLSEDNPVMGDEATQQLSVAGAAMADAAQSFAAGRLAQATQKQRGALDALRALRQQLSQAKGGAGGMPTPMGTPRPKQSGGSGTSPSGADNQAEVNIPKADDNHSNSWREQLLDYAKQTPPLHYEEAVRRYYDELMR